MSSILVYLLTAAIWGSGYYNGYQIGYDRGFYAGFRAGAAPVSTMDGFCAIP